MRCPIETREGEELLLAYSRGTLDSERALTLENHVRECGPCGAYTRAQASVDEALNLWQAPAVSADFDRKLYRRIEQDVPWWSFLTRPFQPGGRLIPVATAAALL